MVDDIVKILARVSADGFKETTGYFWVDVEIFDILPPTLRDAEQLAEALQEHAVELGYPDRVVTGTIIGPCLHISWKPNKKEIV